MTDKEYLYALAETYGIDILSTTVVGGTIFGFTHKNFSNSYCIETLEGWLYHIGKLSPFSVVYAESREYYADSF